MKPFNPSIWRKEAKFGALFEPSLFSLKIVSSIHASVKNDAQEMAPLLFEGAHMTIPLNPAKSKRLTNPAAIDAMLRSNAKALSEKWARRAATWMSQAIKDSGHSASGEAAENIKVADEGDYWVVYEGHDRGRLGDNVFYHNSMIRYGIQGHDQATDPNQRKRHGTWRAIRKPTRHFKNTKARLRSYWQFTGVSPNTALGRIIAWLRTKVRIASLNPKKGTKTTDKVEGFLVLRSLAFNGSKADRYNYVDDFFERHKSSMQSDLDVYARYIGYYTAKGIAKFIGNRWLGNSNKSERWLSPSGKRGS